MKWPKSITIQKPNVNEHSLIKLKGFFTEHKCIMSENKNRTLKVRSYLLPISFSLSNEN